MSNSFGMKNDANNIFLISLKDSNQLTIKNYNHLISFFLFDLLSFENKNIINNVSISREFKFENII